MPECVLLAVQGDRLLRCPVRVPGTRVPWASGARADPGPGGVSIRPAGGPPVALPHGAAVRLGGVSTSCVEAEPQPDGSPAVRLGPDLVAASDVMVRVLHQAICLAPLPDPVLLLGESGCGKDLLARALHAGGRGPDLPYVAVNLAALPIDLVEAELFGWVRGAFTGAIDSRPGAFESAGGGTLFLDEVAESPIAVQAKLLRAVESGAFARLGAARQVEVRARVVAATNRDPGRAVAQGALRLDLLERLACLVLRMPPLRARPADVGPIARRLCAAMPGSPVPDDAAIAALRAYDWPGNVRELRNVVRRAAVASPAGAIDAAAVREAIEAGRVVGRPGSSPGWWPEAATAQPCAASGVREPESPGRDWRPREPRSARIAASGLPRSTYYWRLKRGLVQG
ncbi:MAG: sigma-54-dependent Fis family transcriptional regulator [Deltaproteobacteria bacterium]|nr:sigma-54-dependent Fis family transcriptional regulator [Deltaproteobacteria bacterium]